MNEDSLFNRLFDHYVINGEPIAGARSPRRRDNTFPMHRTPSGACDPLGLLAGEYYDTELETVDYAKAIDLLRNRVPENHIARQIDPYALLAAINFHESLVIGSLRTEIRFNRRPTARSQWLLYILKASNPTGTMARSPALRKITRIVTREAI